MKWIVKSSSELYVSSSGLSKASDQFGYGFPFLSYKDVFNNYYAPEKLNTLVNSTEKDRQKCSVKRGDVFLTRTSETTDELGMSCVALKDYENATFNGFTKRLRPLTEEIVPEYAAYFFRSSYFRAQCQSLASLITRASLNDGMIRRFKIRFPKEKKCQEKIGKILLTYDSLIENNTKRIRLLEKMAENLYKEWFVRFRFPGHEKVEMENGLPKGWKVCQLSKISDYSNCKAPNNKGLFYISTENMLKEYGGIDETVPSEWPEANVTKVDVGDILVSNIRPYFKKIWLADKEAGCSNDVLNIRAKEGICPIFLYYSIRRDSFFDHMVAGSNGTKMPRGSKEFTMKYSVIVPSNNVMVEFSRIIERLIHNKRTLQHQNTLLVRQRDLLLPRLMSGKLEVKP